nr:hypothetical protein B0A51_07735 [Rachicladosporium sp. CCFEE 5018]
MGDLHCSGTSPCCPYQGLRWTKSITTFAHFDNEEVTPQLRTIPGPSVSPFPTDDDVRAAFDLNRCPPDRPFVFYTEVGDGLEGSNVARDFARSIRGVYIADFFPGQYVCGITGNWEQSWWPSFVVRASGVYADMAGGDIYLVTDFMQGVRFHSTTYARMEARTLLDRGRATITHVDAHNTGSRSVLPITISPKPTASTSQNDIATTSSSNDTLARRKSVHLDYMLNWNGYGDDPTSGCPNKQVGMGYSAGQCGIHIQQKENTQPSGLFGAYPSKWPLVISIKDSDQEVIGMTSQDMLGSSYFSMSSLLPYTVDFGTGWYGAYDTDPLDISYAGWKTQTNGPACTSGKYDHGRRQIDCGFPCA